MKPEVMSKLQHRITRALWLTSGVKSLRNCRDSRAANASIEKYHLSTEKLSRGAISTGNAGVSGCHETTFLAAQSNIK
ncbi:MAG: hypothetical protein N2V78_13085 [Methanophagales archaeon]|nr:hypothetical protein [Methanophagales archaeon]